MSNKFIYAIILLISSHIAEVEAKQLASSGVILQYHHISNTAPPSTSVSLSLFEQQMEYIAQHHIALTLPRLVEEMRLGNYIPDRAVAITFDDGYRDIFENARPILKRLGIPYTVFINPDLIDRASDQLTWQQIQTMKAEGVLFANHTMNHRNLLIRTDNQNETQWLASVLQDINTAETIIESRTGQSLRFLAYPYGEFDNKLKTLLTQNGYTGFAQHSGAVAQYSDFAALPRFPVAGPYAKLDTLKVKLNSLAMPVLATTVVSPVIYNKHNEISMGLRIAVNDVNVSAFRCFYNGNAIEVKTQGNYFEVNLTERLPLGRSRINCTAPSLSKTNRYYWYSQPWFVKSSD